MTIIDHLPNTACEHANRELRYQATTDGRRSYWRQCLRCGALGSQVKVAQAEEEIRQGHGPKPVDKDLRRRFYDQAWGPYQRWQQEQRQQEDNRFWEWYSTYLKSPRWRNKRDLVLMRANGVCEGCEDAKATQVHHLTYVRVGDELLFDLVAVCNDCHQKAHPDKDLGAGGPIE